MTAIAQSMAYPEPPSPYEQAQEVFHQWTDVVYHVIAERLNSIKPQLEAMGVFLLSDTSDPYPSVAIVSPPDPEDWSMEIQLHKPLWQQADDQWRAQVQEIALPALQPRRHLLPALGVNEYLFEGLNNDIGGSVIPIEPYGDSDLVKYLNGMLKPVGGHSAADQY